MRLTPAQTEQFDRDGYLFFPGMFSAEETAALTSAVPELYSRREAYNVREKGSEAVRTNFAAHMYSKPFAKLARHPRMIEPVQDLLGEELYMHQFKINGKMAFEGDVWQWHQDYGTWLNDDMMPTERAMNIAIFLDDVNEYNGPLMFIPGSHKRGVVEAKHDLSTTSYPLWTVDNGLITQLVERAGGIPRFVTLKPPHWTFTEADLEAAFSPRTRAVLFNNPLNPTGTVYERAQIELLARFCVRFNAIAICDEVWEHVVFDGRRHVSMLEVPSMRHRAVKIGSAGKIFSLTGWKVGLVAAGPEIMKVIAKAHQFLTFTTPPNLQVAVAYGLGKDDAYFAAMRAGFQRSRDRFCEGLRARGFPVIPSDGTYFVNIDIGQLGLADDVAFCRSLVEDYGVAAIPVSAFYAQDHVTTVVRFCFAKNDSTLDAGLERLENAVARFKSERR